MIYKKTTHSRVRMLCAIGLVFLFCYNLSLIRFYISSLYYPLVRMQHGCIHPLISWLKENKNKHELQKELELINQKYEQLLSEHIGLRSSISFMHDSKELRSYMNKFKFDHIIVPILSKQFSDDSHHYIIDGGHNRGYQIDMIAVYNNCLVGKIIEVFPWYSKVLLVTDQNCKVAVKTSSSGIEGIHEGQNVLESTKIRYIPHIKHCQQGEQIFSSGQGLIFPPGFCLGTVRSCEPNGVYYDITVEPLIDLKSLSYCALLDRKDC